MLILWQLKSSHSATISWGKTQNYEEGGKSISGFENDYQMKALISNLTPNSQYFYRVSIDGVAVYSGSFRSGAAEDTDKIKFYMYGDTRSHPNNHDKVAKALLDEVAKDPNSNTFVISTGDLVSYGNLESKWDSEFFDYHYSYTSKMLANIPYLATLGNHEGSGKLFGKYFPYSMFKTNRYYYSFDYGPAHFSVIDQFTDYSPGSE